MIRQYVAVGVLLVVLWAICALGCGSGPLVTMSPVVAHRYKVWYATLINTGSDIEHEGKRVHISECWLEDIASCQYVCWLAFAKRHKTGGMYLHMRVSGYTVRLEREDHSGDYMRLIAINGNPLPGAGLGYGVRYLDGEMHLLSFVIEAHKLPRNGIASVEVALGEEKRILKVVSRR